MRLGLFAASFAASAGIAVSGAAESDAQSERPQSETAKNAAAKVAEADSVKAPLDGAGWALVWSDEFDEPELDRTKWAPEQSCWGGGNNERQCYTDRPENIAIENGILLLKARKEAFTGPDRPPEIAASPNPQVSQDYTSGKIRTRGLHAWKYGRIEARAKVPAGQGMWPAIWMMPVDAHYGGWPLSGEIDILETVNVGAKCDECSGDKGENRTVSALHFGDYPPDNAYVDQKTAMHDGTLPSDGFHVYAVEWGKGAIRFLIDDRVHFVATREDWYSASPKAQGNPDAPFDKPFYLMANLAVGGAWPERSNEKGLAKNALPNQFMIDWIRVYQCREDSETGLACMQ